MLRINKHFLVVIMGLLLSLSFSAYADTINSLFHQDNDPKAGNPNGNVTIVEFFDYQCGHCVSMAPVMQAIIKANPNVRVIYKDYPIRNSLSEFAARAALAANKQHQYQTFSHALLLANQPLTEESVLEIAKNTGLNVEKLKADMNSNIITNDLRRNAKLAEELNINGTPAFIIGKSNAANTSNVTFVLGEMSQSELQNAINKANT